MMCPIVSPLLLTLPRTQQAFSVNIHCSSTEEISALFYFYYVSSICLCSSFKNSNYPYMDMDMLVLHFIHSSSTAIFSLIDSIAVFLHSIQYLSISFVLDTNFNFLPDEFSSLLSPLCLILFLLFWSTCSFSLPYVSLFSFHPVGFSYQSHPFILSVSFLQKL